MKPDEIYNLILKIAKRLDKPRSFLGIIQLIKLNGASPEILFLAIRENNDDLISSFIIERTKLMSQLGVEKYFEREMTAVILSSANILNNNAEVVNKTFEQKGLQFRLPPTLDDGKIQLIRNIVVANNCVEICRIGDNSEVINEISFYAKFYLNVNLAKIKECQKTFSETYKYSMDNILDIDDAKKRIIDTLTKHIRPSNVLMEDSIDKVFRILDRETAAMEVVVKARESVKPINENNVSEYVTIWFLYEDLKRRTAHMYEKIETTK